MKTGISFYDIHCHVLPGLDDGPGTIEESLRMLEIAREDGIKVIAATPHMMDGVHNVSRDSIAGAVDNLNALLSDGPRVVSGADIRICIDLIGKVERRELPLINGGNYFLIEMPSYGIPPLLELKNLVSNLKMRRFVPVITHPERNFVLAGNLSIMAELRKMGALFQITAGSIIKAFGPVVQKSALRMLKKGLVDVVATDAHDPEKRPPILSHAYKFVADKFGAGRALRLFSENPLKIIENGVIDSQF